MKPSPIHRFGNLIFDLEITAEEGDKFALPERVKAVFLEKVLPQMEAMMDQMTPNGEMIQIDRLTLDVGDIENPDWEEIFVAACLEQFQSIVENTLSGSPAMQALEVERADAQQWHGHQVRQYLLTGHYQATEADFPLAKDRIMALVQSNPSALQDILVASWDQPQAFLRLVFALPKGLMQAFLGAWMAAVSGAKPFVEEASELMDTLRRWGLLTESMERLVPALHLWVLAMEASGRKWDHPQTAAAWIRKEIGTQAGDLNELSRDSDHAYFRIVAYLVWMKRAHPDGLVWRKKPARRDQAMSPPKEKNVLAALDWIRKKTSPTPSALTDPKKKPMPEMNTDVIKQGPLDGQSAPFSVINAGVVLIHPFLPGLFEYLELQKDGQFLDDAARFKAIHLIHHLATSQPPESEEQLWVAKVLCGMDPEAAVPLEDLLSDAEKAACQELLVQVVDQWPAMKGSSPEGLQEAFLQRKGTLEMGSTAWRMRVEPFMLDLLLSSLPWGIAFVYYPWMPTFMYVEWA